ncbi:MAG: hypothetical protein ABIQ74_01105 [Chitinophagales bacterium]
MHTGLELTAPSFSAENPAQLTLKRVLKVLGVYGLFISAFGVLIKSPISLFYLIFVGYPLLFVYFTFFLIYFFDKLFNKAGSFSRYEYWAVIMIMYVMLSAGIMANIYYGQPVFTGMKSEKSWIPIFLGFLFFYLLKVKVIDLKIVRDALLFGAWLQLPVFVLLILTLNPNHYAGTLFVYCNSVKGGCQFEFDIFVFAFASIYYFIRFVRTNKLWYGIFFIVFFAYIFFVNQKRGTSLALAGTFGVYFLLNLKWDKIIVYALGFGTALISGILMLYFVFPDVLSRVQHMYYDVYQVLTGHQVAEASAQARIRESAIAFKYFARNDMSWLFGNGKTDNDWGGQPQDLDHYYPSDIGILGIIWQFGILGLLIGLYQYYLVFSHHRKITTSRNSSFYQAVLYFLIFFFVRGIPTGGSWFDPGIAIASVFVAIHYFFYYTELHPDRRYIKPG